MCIQLLIRTSAGSNSKWFATPGDAESAHRNCEPPQRPHTYVIIVLLTSTDRVYNVVLMGVSVSVRFVNNILQVIVDHQGPVAVSHKTELMHSAQV